MTRIPAQWEDWAHKLLLNIFTGFLNDTAVKMAITLPWHTQRWQLICNRPLKKENTTNLIWRDFRLFLWTFFQHGARISVTHRGLLTLQFRAKAQTDKRLLPSQAVGKHAANLQSHLGNE